MHYQHWISPDCALNITDTDNERLLEWLGRGEHFPWSVVLGDMSKGCGVGVDCPGCGQPTAEVQTGYCPGPLCGDGGKIDVCIKCKIQTNYRMEWIS